MGCEDVAQIHGDHLSEHDKDIRELQLAVARSEVHYSDMKEDIEEIQRDVKNIHTRQAEMAAGIGRIEGTLSRMNGNGGGAKYGDGIAVSPQPPQPSYQPPNSGTPVTNGRLPLPPLGTKEWYFLALLTVLGLPGGILATIWFILWVFF